MDKNAQHSRPLTPDQVATIWGCSPNHVRNLIHRGELRAFRLGKRLFRVPAEALDEYEQRMMVDVSVPTTSGLGAQSDDQHVANDSIVIIHSRERKRRAAGRADLEAEDFLPNGAAE